MSRRSVLVISGPNLAALGTREPEVYGTTTLTEVHENLRALAADLGVDVECRQSDDEATIIGWLHEAVSQGADVVLNPAAFTHYSYALRDACAHAASLGVRIVEVHLSQPASREAFRRTSVVADVVMGTVSGMGAAGYALALRALADA